MSGLEKLKGMVSLFPKLQLIPVLNYQVMLDYVYLIAPWTTVLN